MANEIQPKAKPLLNVDLVNEQRQRKQVSSSDWNVGDKVMHKAWEKAW